MYFGKKQVLPLSHAERLQNTMKAFTQAKDELTDLRLEIAEQIDEHEAAILTLRKDQQAVVESLQRIKSITG